MQTKSIAIGQNIKLLRAQYKLAAKEMASIPIANKAAQAKAAFRVRAIDANIKQAEKDYQKERIKELNGEIALLNNNLRRETDREMQDAYNQRLDAAKLELDYVKRGNYPALAGTLQHKMTSLLGA